MAVSDALRFGFIIGAGEKKNGGSAGKTGVKESFAGEDSGNTGWTRGAN